MFVARGPSGCNNIFESNQNAAGCTSGVFNQGGGDRKHIAVPTMFFLPFFFRVFDSGKLCGFFTFIFFCRVYRGSMSPSRLRTAGFRRCSSQEGREAGSLCVSGDGPPPDPAGSGGRHPRRGRRHPGAHCRGGLPAGGGGQTHTLHFPFGVFPSFGLVAKAKKEVVKNTGKPQKRSKPAQHKHQKELPLCKKTLKCKVRLRAPGLPGVLDVNCLFLETLPKLVNLPIRLSK